MSGAFLVGDRVKLKMGISDVVGCVIEDRGHIGVGGRQLLRVEVGGGETATSFEVNADDLQVEAFNFDGTITGRMQTKVPNHSASPGYTMSWRYMVELERFRVYDDSPIVAEVGAIDATSWRSGGFTVWTLERVYFDNSYDGMARVSSVARHPCDTQFGFENGDPTGDEVELGVFEYGCLAWGGEEACEGVLPHANDPCDICGATRDIKR